MVGAWASSSDSSDTKSSQEVGASSSDSRFSKDGVPFMTAVSTPNKALGQQLRVLVEIFWNKRRPSSLRKDNDL
ncbi:hypothetical protein ACHAW5_008329 [Stephanodiscus triporus]|uniref:Uncharacterized protein n=1 Tax=Stephanodiscus triporus TaxID=2934178 RepID=A0ABD3PC98_9STRA